MKKNLLTWFGVLGLSSSVWAGGPLPGSEVSWSYAGERGPAAWGELDERFKLCSIGKNQTPIDISGFIEAELPPLKLNYQAGAGEILNNGHTVKVEYPAGSSLEIDGQSFELKQFHFHSPSENHVEGQSFPMEAHLVHVDSAGNIAVVAVMFSEGDANPLISALWQHMPTHKGDKHALEQVDVNGLLPAGKDYYRFNGSLTTPPCLEGVRWLVLKQAVTVSAEQVASFTEVMHHPNNRPLQPVNARPILK